MYFSFLYDRATKYSKYGKNNFKYIKLSQVLRQTS